MKRIFLLDSLWLISLCAYIIIGTASTPFHGDESTLLFMNRDYDYQFIQRDLSKIYFANPPINQTEQELRLLNGTVYKYVVGFARTIRGIGIDGLNEFWDWTGDITYNRQTNRYPSDDLLMTARYVLVPFLALGVIALFFITKNLGGRFPAYLASAYFALNPPLLLNGRRAMMESLLVAFCLLTLLCAIWWIKRPSWRNAAFLGISAGLAMSSKHPAILTLIPIFGVCGLIALSQKNRVILLTKIISSGLIVIGIFFALNVSWWQNPIDSAREVLRLRGDLLTVQVDIFGGYGGFGDQLRGFWEQVFLAQPQFYEVDEWSGYIGDQITAYESSLWDGVALGGHPILGVIITLLTILGVWACLRIKSVPLGVRWLVVIWGIFQLITSLFLTPLEWQRYYLMAYPAIAIFASMGILWIIKINRRVVGA
jgi:4-amino-4-deoxy-L-arabinose transferase-like glycosyltransferase